MAADESVVPAGSWPGKGFWTQLLNDINTAVSLGVVSATSDTVLQLIQGVTAEQGKR